MAGWWISSGTTVRLVLWILDYGIANCLPESDTHPDVSSDPRISVVPLPPHPSLLQTSNKLLFLFFAPLKVIFQIVCLWRCLAYRTESAKWLIVQVSRVGLFS